MARLNGACFGLLTFSAMLVAGMLAGNPVDKIVLRALFGLAAGYVLGCLAGWIGLCVVHDNTAAAADARPETLATVKAAGDGQSVNTRKQT